MTRQQTWPPVFQFSAVADSAQPLSPCSLTMTNSSTVNKSRHRSQQIESFNNQQPTVHITA